jgi:hypothetical protein
MIDIVCQRYHGWPGEFLQQGAYTLLQTLKLVMEPGGDAGGDEGGPIRNPEVTMEDQLAELSKAL